jgi:hypothetical protein
MIYRLTLHRFKQFRDATFDLTPAGVTLVAGGNNSGKSSILHALAVWEFCRTALEMEKGPSVFLAGAARQGLGLGDEQFSPIEVPSLRHLWTNLNPQRAGEPDGYTLKITCTWSVDGAEDVRFLEFGLSLANDRLFMKPTGSNLVAEDTIPRIAYLPPFAGITAREMRLPGAIRRRRIGEGLAGAVLRNLLLDMFDANQAERARLREGRTKISDADLRRLRATDPWELLQNTLRTTFSAELVIAPFSDEYHSYIQVEIVKGTVTGFQLKRHPNFKNRDLMVEGSGFLQWLSVYALAVNPTVDVLLLDEPDAHLHTSLQDHLVEELELLASRTGKQILIATHSSEILRQARPASIFEVRGTQGGRYLRQNEQKVPLLAGLGSDYAPRVDRARRTRRLLFIEGSSDAAILRDLAGKLQVPWPDTWVEWRSTAGHRERKHVFLALREEIPDLVAISLRDRDDEPLSTVAEDLTDLNAGELDDFRCLKWRRRYIESYLIWPPALALASGLELDLIESWLRDNHGIAISAENFLPSDAPDALLDLRAKEILKEGDEAIFGQLSVTARDVAQALEAEFIPQDIRTFLDELVRLG